MNENRRWKRCPMKIKFKELLSLMARFILNASNLERSDRTHLYTNTLYALSCLIFIVHPFFHAFIMTAKVFYFAWSGESMNLYRGLVIPVCYFLQGTDLHGCSAITRRSHAQNTVYPWFGVKSQSATSLSVKTPNRGSCFRAAEPYLCCLTQWTWQTTRFSCFEGLVRVTLILLCRLKENT